MTPGEDPIAEDAYDEVADTYAREVDTNPYNADLDFPATTDLLPDVTGKRVLDAGCGSGVYTEWLLDHGAEVVAVDVSEAMLEHAAERVGDRAAFHRADLGKPLDFAADGDFDGVVSGLALGHVKDWHRTFTEFARVLEPGGFVVFSVSHPLDDYLRYEDANYFEVELRHLEWEVEVPYYRRPFSAIVDPLLETGFRIDELVEPQPTEAFEEKRPEAYETESEKPCFLCLRAIKR